MPNPTSLKLAVALALAAASSTAAFAQDNGALIDKLVKKGILSSQEAEEVRADLTREYSTTTAGKIQLSNSVTEMKLSGDLRLRYQYDNKDQQVDPVAIGSDKDHSPSGNQRSRWRFRLRLNADFKLTDHFYGGVELGTNLASDSSNQTVENGFNKYPIYISKAYLGWNPSGWLNVTAGKFTNPFYTTDLVWDPDINPNGVSESVAFHKMYFGGSEAGYSKDGKTASAPIKEERPWELTLVGGQFIFDDNIEGGGKDNATRDNDTTSDVYLFETQIIASYKFGGVKATFAPAWMIYTSGSVTGADNENSFNDNPLVSGASRNLNIIQAPGDVSFKLGSLKTKVYWDFAYNIEGRKRVENIYRLATLDPKGPGATPDPDDFDKNHSNRDDYAYLIGVQVGENKKKGDWSALANWRQTGIGAVDPNLNDSDFALGELNTKGFKLGVAYNFTDFCIAGVTYMHAWNLRRDLSGGEATGGNAIGEANAIQVLQVDLNLKF